MTAEEFWSVAIPVMWIMVAVDVVMVVAYVIWDIRRGA